MSEKELREMDTWIAEHVMGWTVISDTLCDPKPEVKHGQQTGDVELNPVAPLPYYTIDPAAVMLVLEKCLMHPLFPCGFKVAYSKGFSEPYVCGNQKADTLPLAICLFAKQLYARTA